MAPKKKASKKSKVKNPQSKVKTSPKTRKRRKKAKKSKKTFKMAVFKGVAAIIALISFFFVGYIAHLATSSIFTLKDRMEGRRFIFPSKIYSLTSTFYPGMELSKGQFVKKLIRLGYKSVRRVSKKGSFSVDRSGVTVFTNNFSMPPERLTARKVKFIFAGNGVARIKNLSTNRGLSYIEFEPELLAVIYGVKRQSRKFIPYSQIPKYLIQGIVSTEDKRFYKHFGIDPKSIVRAFYVNLKAGRIVQGGSTITQQLAKNFFLTPERTMKRKLSEAVMAVIMDYYYSKEQILECYLNEVYWGQRGSIEIHGVGEAAKYYFNKEPMELSISECAVLGAIIKGPQIYSPYRNMGKAVKRRNSILNKMVMEKFITKDVASAAKREKINLAGYTILPKKAPYFIDFLKQQLVKNYSKSDLEQEGLRIFTTVDTDLQILAENALKNGIKKLEKKYASRKLNKLNGCILVMQPQTGYIMALVGGRDYLKSQFNRAVQARRQVGSLFKPIVYLSAVMSKKFTAASILNDTPLSMKVEDKIWTPANFSKTFSGEVLLRKALEKSMNVPTVRLGNAVGFDMVFDVARKLGIKTPLPRMPSLFLGAVELTPLEILSAYSTIANYGVRTNPVTIKKVIGRDGSVLERKFVRVSKGVPEDASFIIISLLKGVMQNGTGRSVRRLGLNKEAAGKTGTTSNYRDAWFVGFTPNLACLVWVGRDDSKSVKLTGGQAALPIWTDFIKNATKSRNASFIVPDGVVTTEIDDETGLLASENCPLRREEYFLEGTIPQEYCVKHNAVGIQR